MSDGGVRQRIHAGLAAIREGRRADQAMLAAFLVGLVAPVVHWAGLVVGGVAVGFVAPTLRRALVTGLYLAGLVLCSFALFLFVVGALPAYLGMGVVLAANLGVTVGLPVLGAVAARGLT